jgi:hypothetical protein
MKNRFFLMFALMAAVGAVHATKHAGVSAARRAPSLEAFGFKLGLPPTLLPCPATREGVFDGRSWSATMDSTCLERPTSGGTTADGRSRTSVVHFNHSDDPRIVAATALSLQILDGTVQGIRVRTRGISAQKSVFAMLRKKYGVPSDLSREPLENGSRKVDSIRAVWTFSDLEVTFEGAGATPDEGSFSISTVGSLAYGEGKQD